MLTLVWHLFLLVWVTAVLPGGAYFVYNSLPSRRFSREIQQQAAQTRIAELRARENYALDQSKREIGSGSGG